MDYGRGALSRAVQSERVRQGLRSSTQVRNGAAALYRGQDGRLRIMVKFNEPEARGPFSEHAEEVLRTDLQAKGVSPGDVKAIYSELQPCTLPGNYCQRMLDKEFPGVPVSWSFGYGDTPGSRAAGVAALQAAVHRIQ